MAIIVTSALIAGVFYSVGLEHRTSGNTIRQQQAFSAAEEGVYETVAGWNILRDSIPLGAVVVEQSATAGVTGVASRKYITRLDTSLFWLVGEGRVEVGRMVGKPDTIIRRVNLAVRAFRDSSRTYVVPLPQRGWAELF